MRETPPAERVLAVSSREGRGREVEILVADRGPGIAREIADQIFDPFATTKKEGLGLGLSISRTIVQAHNGHLSVGDGSDGGRSEEHTSELQALMRTSYAVFCLKTTIH